MFGASSTAAVQVFQRPQHLTADGVVGPRSWAVTLQRLLHVSPVGVFGPQTKAAVVAFQRTHHLATDGVVGPKTWSALSAGR